MAEEEGGIPKLLKTRIRSYLLSCDNHKEPLQTFPSNFAQIYKAFSPAEYGFKSMQDLMQAVGPEYVRISNEYGHTVLYGVTNDQNKHIVNMIDKQKKPKKKKARRDVGIFPRYQGSGYRPAGRTGQQFSRQNPPFNVVRRPYGSSYPRPMPHMTAVPRPQHLPKPQKPYHQVVNLPPKQSAHDRLGPKPIPKPYQSRYQILSPSESGDSRTVKVNGNKTESRMPIPSAKAAAKPKEPVVVKSEPAPIPKPPAGKPEVYVDLKPASDSSSSDENFDRVNQLVACEDPEFLKLLVRHLLATLEDPQRSFTAAGITSRMRRQLVRSGIDIPNYLDEVMLQFMCNDWDDCFSVIDVNDITVQSEFTFTAQLREAYSLSMRQLPTHNELDFSTVTVKVTSVCTPAFYVMLTAEEYTKKYEEMTTLLREYIESEPADILTYRTDELCAVYIEPSKRYMRGRLTTYRIKVSPFDQSSSQISLVALVFLVDTGEIVTVPAGDVYRLPDELCEIAPFAYRCIFSGARVIDQQKFTAFMNSYQDKEVELTVVATQKSVDGIVLQVRLIGSSYLMDDLVSEKVMYKVTISEPDPKPFPVNQVTRVRFADWHQGYRTVLVQRYSNADLKCLSDLEVQLGTSVDRTKFDGVIRPRVDCLYLWLQSNGAARRVRCVSVSDVRIVLQCLDHGCRCMVKDCAKLYLPEHPKLITLFSKLPFMTNSIPLAMLPDFSVDDVMLNKNSTSLKHEIRNMCPTDTILQIRHDTSVSESPRYILTYDDDVLRKKPSVNIQFLALFMDMNKWPEKQRFSAVLAPLDEDKAEGPIDGWRRWIIRFDSDGCSPNFAVPLQEYRYMERCCLDFTLSSFEGTSKTLIRLSDLPHDDIIDINTKIVFLSERDQSRAVRATLVRPYCSRGSRSVSIRLVDNPLKCICTADANFLFTLDERSVLDAILDNTVIDVTKSEIQHFSELLQHLPPLDQIVMTAEPLTSELSNCPEANETPIDLEIATFTFDGNQRLPLVKKQIRSY